MKNYLCTLALVLFTMASIAQSKEHRFGITLGAGSQKYQGDLGNGFTLKNNCWYGTYASSASYYLCKHIDATVLLTAGSYGFSQPDDIKMKEVLADDQCPGCIGRKGIGNVSCRLYSAGLMVKYKFANGCILKEDSRIRPYVYFGASAIQLVDNMKMNCVQAGNYTSLNAGVGVKYYLSDRLNIGYNMHFGNFTADHLDYKMKNGDNDRYLQQTLTVGVDLF